MRHKLQRTILIMFFLLLVGCQPTVHDKISLMQHPEVLKQKVTACRMEKHGVKVNEDCQMVFSAAQEFSNLLMQQVEDPQSFGAKILKLQMQYAKDCDAPNKDRACVALKNNIKVHLTVAGLNSP